MALIRVTKEFNFEMAHALKNYDGPCKHIHGHSYKLFVTVIGQPNTDEGNPKLGMLIDFGDLKKLIKNAIVDVFDHAFVLNSTTDFECTGSVHEMFGNTIYVDYQPTCENLISDYAQRIQKIIPNIISLHSLRLYETETSYAEWFASDNM
ncbi:MAG: 6-carboxytetrahydropterin synthase [Salinivirgaceae bacterium]|jgi:6-pyruvoyltetrahydropterin/6-carboxytetrahydropterin synthase|nr:6-carboxytetrahydropterin synthase [Salinivirgaceae bacterium]